MPAIIVKFLPETNTRCARYKASTGYASATVGNSYADMSGRSDAWRAVEALVRKCKWLPSSGKAFVGTWHMDETSDCFVAVFVPDNTDEHYVRGNNMRRFND